MTGCGTKLMSSSKKRKHQQISPFAELHLRRSRSGRTLLDLPPKPSTQSPYVLCANSKHPIDENPEIFDVDEQISIKDLRARRVFSLASTEQVDVEGNKKKLKSDVVIEGCDRDDCVQDTPPDTVPDGLHVMKNLSSSNLNKNPKFKEKHPSFKGILFSYTSTDEEDRCLRWLILDFTIEQYYSVFSLYDEEKKEFGDLDADCDRVKLQAAYFALRVLYFVSKRSTALTLSPLKMPWAMNEVNKSIINMVIGFLTS